MRRIRVAIAFLLISTGILHAQKIHWNIVEAPDDLSPSDLPAVITDSINGRWYQEVLSELHYEGYLSAAVSLPVLTDSVVDITLYVGPLYTWANLHAGDVPEIILSHSGYRRRDFSDKPFHLKELQQLFDDILSYSENNGYPFAGVWLDSVMISENAVNASLRFDPGPEITFDSLNIEGMENIKTAWLMSYLQIRPGQPFSQETVDRIPARIRRLPFVKSDDEIRITFQNEEATIYLPLTYVRSDVADGVIGFLPNEENDGGIRITGQADLELNNLFRSGKQLRISWQRVKPLSQILLIGYRHMNLLHSPVHIDGSFNLLKEDSTFINREFRIGLTYTAGLHEIGFISRFKRTRLLSTTAYENIEELPGLSDQNVNYYGLEYLAGRSDELWAGNKGWKLSASAAIGDKEIRRNTGLPPEVYENLELKTLQWMAGLEVSAGFRLGKRSLLYQRASTGVIYDDQLLLNDLYRIGGLRTLRGFNENNFFVSEFLTLTLEYQVYFEEESYLFLFTDQGFLRNSVTDISDNPTGFGVGMNLRTGGGMLQLAYALGRNRDQEINFSLSKFHFGYVAKF